MYLNILDMITYHIFSVRRPVSVQGKEERTRDKKMVIGVSAKSGQGGGQPTPPVHCINMDK